MLGFSDGFIGDALMLKFLAVETWQRGGRRVFWYIEKAFDAAFGPAINPFYHLGALLFYLFWIVTASGIYVYIFFETGIDGAYRSVEYLTNTQWYLGGVARSLHRYASDGMVALVLLHIAREFTLDRYRGVRWYSWVIGAFLLWLLYASGITGYWLVWDRLAQYVAITTSEWFDWLGIFGEPIARNFLSNASVNDRFFSLMSFMHIAIPLFLLLGMWIHLQRITSPRTNPPRAIMAGTLFSLLLLAFVYPALSQGPANLDTVYGTVRPDWFYLSIYPLIEKWSPGTVWALVGGGTLILLLLPWLPRRKEQPAAIVNLENCNGCGRCFADCPFSAVVLQPRTDGLPFETEAVVDPDLCTRCGICAGACPTSTPFRRTIELNPGIDLPGFPVRALREQTLAATAKLSGTERVMVYGCSFGASIKSLDGHGVATLVVPCIGAIPPSFIDFIISRRHADGVILAGCTEGDCYQRLGIEWTKQRMEGRRDPVLRRHVPRRRVAAIWAGKTGGAMLLRELEEFRAQLRALGPYHRGGTTPPAAPTPHPLEARDGAYRLG